MVTTLSKVGNSMAVLLPKAVRQEACIEAEVPLELSSPRKGVVVITALEEDGADRLARLSSVEERIAARARNAEPWPKGATADALLKQGKEGRAHEIAAL